MAEQWTVKGVDGQEPKTSQEQEKEVLEQAVETGEVTPEAAGVEEDTIKVDLDNPPVKEETPEAAVEEVKEEEEQVIEIVDEEEKVEEVVAEAPVEEKPPLPEYNLPENVDKLVQFMNDNPGATVEDYVNLNRSYEDLSPVNLVREHYRQSKPHLSEQEVTFLIEDKFGYDEDADDREKRSKEIAWKEEVYNSKRTLTANKDKYYADLKFKNAGDISPEYKEAYDFYTKSQEQIESNKQLQQTFKAKTDEVFNEFKGFDFKVGDKKYRYKVNDVESTKTYQSDLNNLVKEFLGDDGSIKDAAGYHKAIFAAKHADKIAQHFYEQGKSDGLKADREEAKNIDMSARSEGAITTGDGMKVKVVSGDSSDKLKINWKPKLKNY